MCQKWCENDGDGTPTSPSNSPENMKSTCNVNKTALLSTKKNSIQTTEWNTSTFVSIILSGVSRGLSRGPLVSLSMLWIFLCSGLVWKYHELSCVFFAYCGSFALSYTLQTVPSLLPGAGIPGSSLQIRIKAIVGLTACSIQWYYLLDSLSTTLTDDERIRPILAGNDTTSSCHMALSVAAGYLAFDHWYWALYLQNQKSVWCVVEDTVALIVFMIVLVYMAMLRRRQRPLQEQHDDELLNVESFVQTVLFAWTVIQLCRFGSILVSHRHVVTNEKGRPYKNNRRQTPAVKSLKATQATAASVTPIKKSKYDTESAAVAMANRYWKIHGVTYDLSTYVDQHPGGREAIMLGQGRDDCTALFQSYHPFSASQVAQILHKYRRDVPERGRTSIRAKKSVPHRESGDWFYETLCQRVAKTLREEHQFDPIRDRAATPIRALYYGIVVTAAIVCGIAHCRVRRAQCLLFVRDES